MLFILGSDNDFLWPDVDGVCFFTGEWRLGKSYTREAAVGGEAETGP